MFKMQTMLKSIPNMKCGEEGVIVYAKANVCYLGALALRTSDGNLVVLNGPHKGNLLRSEYTCLVGAKRLDNVSQVQGGQMFMVERPDPTIFYKRSNGSVVLLEGNNRVYSPTEPVYIVGQE